MQIPPIFLAQAPKMGGSKAQIKKPPLGAKPKGRNRLFAKYRDLALGAEARDNLLTLSSGEVGEGILCQFTIDIIDVIVLKDGYGVLLTAEGAGDDEVNQFEHFFLLS